MNNEIQFSASLIPYKELSREEILELGRSRPYKKFIEFPINISIEISGVLNENS